MVTGLFQLRLFRLCATLNSIAWPIDSQRLKRARQIYALTLVVVVIWLGLIVAAPLLLAHHDHLSALVIYQSFAALCHQLPERSFHVFGCPLAVCARCTGIYLGFLCGLIVYPCWRRLDDETMPERRWLLLAAAPMLIDVTGNALGVFANSLTSRTMTGLIAGAAGAFYLLRGLIACVSPDSGNRRLRAESNWHGSEV